MLDPKVMEGLKPSTSKLPITMDIVIHGRQLIKARILKTGHSYMNAQLVQQLRKERYVKGVNVTGEPLNVQEVGFVVEGLSVEKLAPAVGLSHLVQKDGKNYKPVEIFFTLFALCPPGQEPWSSNQEEPLVGLSLFDVSVANVISENVVAKGPKSYPIMNLENRSGGAIRDGIESSEPAGRCSSYERYPVEESINGQRPDWSE